VIQPQIDTKGIERQLMAMANDFGESNESAICRWGVAVARDLVKRTQAWGDDTDAKKKQENAIMKDMNRAVFSVSKPSYVNGVSKGKLSGLVINGELVTFTPDRILKTAKEVNDFIDLNRTDRRGRVPRMKSNMKGIASTKSVNAALKIRFRRAGVAKGGWIGAGISIGSKQRKGSRITIGKNVASYAHKFKSGGTSSLSRSVWTPIGMITNNVAHVSSEHVLKKSDATNAINQGGRMTLEWYKNAMDRKLKRKRR
jgi:hypothetical protein